MVGSCPIRQRFVLFGASNATIGFPTIVDLVRSRAGEPLEIMAATAFGRSFGKKSKIFWRKISGILDCSIWRDLEARPALPTRALITDIGNDILYGEPVDRIAEWVATCVERLNGLGARMALTQLPIGSLSELGPRRFRLFRQLLFPRCGIVYEDAIEYANELNERVLEIAKRHNIPAISHNSAWYGFDPIHVHRRHRTTAWNEFLKPLFDDREIARGRRFSTIHAAYLAALAPAERWIVGVRRKRKQPSGTLNDGTSISLY